MRVQVEIEGVDLTVDVDSLIAALRHHPGLSAALLSASTAVSASLTVGLTSPALAGSFTDVLGQWLLNRRRDVAVAVITPNRTVVQLRADTAEEALTKIRNELMGPAATSALSAGVEENTAEKMPAALAVLSRWRVSPADRAPTDASSLPITIYLSDETHHEQIEAAIEQLVATAGLQIHLRDDPVIGSWFRRMRATLNAVAHSPAAREGALMAAHVADTRLVLAHDAAITATLLQNLGPVIASLQPTKDAVIRVGALLIVKIDWVVNIHQLTAAQQVQLDHKPQLATSPHEIIAALNLASPLEDGGPAAQP